MAATIRKSNHTIACSTLSCTCTSVRTSNRLFSGGHAARKRFCGIASQGQVGDHLPAGSVVHSPRSKKSCGLNEVGCKRVRPRRKSQLPLVHFTTVAHFSTAVSYRWMKIASTLARQNVKGRVSLRPTDCGKVQPVVF